MAFFSRKKKDEIDEVDETSETSELAQAGPYDAAEYGERGDLLDAGSLWIPTVPNATLQFTLNKDRTQVVGIVYLKNDAALQLQAFAAPKSNGIWDEVRLDMRTSIAKQGGSSQEVDGPYGPELRAQMPVANSKTPAPHRFLGVDGPRWLLRITLYGRAGTDEQVADELLDVVRALVVNRGNTPHPPRELLELTIPQEIQKSIADKAK